MKDKIIDKLTEYADAIADELNSEHDETTKATNLYFLRGQFYGLIEAFKIMDDYDKFCALCKEFNGLEARAVIICDNFYQNCKKGR